MTTPPNDRLRDLLADINSRIHFFKRPDPGFDPLAASPDELELHGIPPKPNQAAQPKLFDFWSDMYSPPLEFTDASFSLVSQPLISDQLRMTTNGRRESSLNWSGAYITPRNGRQITEVHARWDVPFVAAPAGRPAYAEYQSSTWIGLDGQRRYFDSSLPQIGTMQVLNAPGLSPFSTWWQWWLRNQTGAFVTLPLAVQPGERVLASLHVLDETHVKFIIENRTTGAIYPPFTMLSPLDPSKGFRPMVSGATAEWIVERPTSLTTGDLYELPNYHEVEFTHCLAVSAVLPPGGTPGPGRDETLDGARHITMYKVESNPRRTVAISKVEELKPDSVTTAYVA